LLAAALRHTTLNTNDQTLTTNLYRQPFGFFCTIAHLVIARMSVQAHAGSDNVKILGHILLSLGLGSFFKTPPEPLMIAKNARDSRATVTLKKDLFIFHYCSILK